MNVDFGRKVGRARMQKRPFYRRCIYNSSKPFRLISMQPRLSKLNLWKRHEERVCEVLTHALILLQNRSGLIQDEDDLNRQLYFCLREANAHFYALGRGVENTIDPPDSRNPPSLSHIKKHPREDKRPDFQWGFLDSSEQDPQKQEKRFCIECKRLGTPPSPKWILNENYVNNGIARFLEETHGYAFEVESSAMVGYVESSDFDIILSDVNTALTAFQSTLLQLQPLNIIWASTEINPLEHTFERPFPISPFTLKHFWIDLRGKVSPQPRKKRNSTKKPESKNSSKSTN